MKRWLVLGLLVCACGSSSSNNNNNNGVDAGSGSITGTVGGQPLAVKDAVFGFEGNAVLVLVGDQQNLCTALGNTTLPSQLTVLLLSLANFTPPSTVNPHDTGDYAFFDLGGGGLPTTAGRYWFGDFDVVGTNCLATATHPGTGGTVTVTQTGNTSGTHFKANLTGLQFGTDTLNGSIEATYCANLINSPCGGALIARPSTAAE
jgi:hypothetical protein